MPPPRLHRPAHRRPDHAQPGAAIAAALGDPPGIVRRLSLLDYNGCVSFTVPVIKLHEGRNSAASLARDAEADPEIRRKTLGHADLASPGAPLERPSEGVYPGQRRRTGIEPACDAERRTPVLKTG